MGFCQKCPYSCARKLTYTAAALTFRAFCVTSDFTSESPSRGLSQRERAEKCPLPWTAEKSLRILRKVACFSWTQAENNVS